MTPQLYALKATTRTFLMRHHAIIFSVFVSLLLAGAVFSLYLVMSAPATATPENDTSTNFNSKTVDQIKKLHDSTDETDKIVFPSPRSNPFTEK